MKRTLLLTFIFAFVLGCAKEKPNVVAKVGDMEITLEELQKRLPAREYKSETEELNVKKSTLDRLIDNKLLLLEAKNRNYQKEKEFKDKIEDVKRDAAIRAMYKEMVIDAINEVADEEAKELWGKLGEEVFVRIITVGTVEEAQQILEELRGGADFAELAKQKSIDRRSAPKGGEIGYIRWDRYPDALCQVAFALNPGEISDVLEMWGKYHIIKVEDKREVERKAFEEDKERLKKVVLGKKRNKVAQDFVDKLREKAGIVIDNEVVSFLVDKAGSQIGEKPSSSISEFTEEENNRIIVRFENKEWTLGEVMDKLGPTVPPLNDVNSVRDNIEGLVIQELLWEEARNRGFHKNKEVEEAVKNSEERELVGRLRQEVLSDIPKPTDDELLQYYETHKNEYKDKEFEKVKNIITMRITGERRREKNREFIDELRKKYPIEIYEENLLVKSEPEDEGK